MRNRRKQKRNVESEFALSELIYKLKSCEICNKKHDEANMVLCDRCEDAYHTRCVRIQCVPKGVWMCQRCSIDVSRLKKDQLWHRRSSQRNITEECAGCKERIKEEYWEYEEGQVAFEARLTAIVTCSACKEKFHSLCFSQRYNAINCTNCEESIRELIPKGHLPYVRFLKESRAKIAELGYYQFVGGVEQEGNYHEYPCFPQMHLLSPQEPKDWRVVTCYQASLCYALTTRGMILCQNLVMEMKTDRLETVIKAHKESVQKIQRLHRIDEMVYEEFKRRHSEGYVPPLEIKQDRQKGFYLTATDFIQINTIIAEYTGEVLSARDSLNMLNNDSIFTLIRNPRSYDSLDIAPGRFANIAIFISGINNSQENATELENVKALKFSYKGIARLIFCALRDIQPYETLYLNYNGDKAICEYPTNNFVH